MSKHFSKKCLGIYTFFAAVTYPPSKPSSLDSEDLPTDPSSASAAGEYHPDISGAFTLGIGVVVAGIIPLSYFIIKRRKI